MKHKLITLSFLFFISIHLIAQSTLSPESFLGYKVGSKFTHHHQVVEYFKALAKADSTKMKVEKYGETYEGRELMLAYISNADNIANLKTIQENNRRLVNNLPLTTNNSKLPTIVWLSYNVHGNEPASTEAAMLTAYELLNPTKKEVNDWLQNTIVIIDPCLNPDGRDRYVNWYNTTVGKNYNADAQSREHSEVYPQGRTNHYNFDLNRDWAWQTQAETKFRIKKYLEWMPHIHVDFHEQGYNDSYYFAPAAEPMHNVITPWQKELQTKIGKNHSKYFDENGWLYFTKQIFDLFYPSYGDTYPTYNGSVGMTYEQGGIAAGLGVNTNANEVLTLTDRVTHHFTTSLSTIEVASKNANQIVDEFRKYFTNNRQGVNAEYQTYIVTSDNENKIKAVADLLNANGISYGKTSATALSGYSYANANAKTENIVFKKYSIAVSTHQSRGSMVTVLFEPNSKLNDSATYDITAWSLPYVYGVDCYATKTNLAINDFSFENNIKTIASNYGFVIPYTSFNSSKLVADLLKNSVKIRIASKPFTIDGNSYNAGTVIVLKNGNANVDWNKVVNDAATKFNIQPIAVSSGFVEKGSDFGSADVKIINAPKVALLTGVEVNANAAGEVWSLFDNQLEYPVSLINADKIANLNFKKYDVIIMPDGGYKSLSDKNNIEKLKDFVRSGGRLIAIQDAVNVLAQTNEFGIKNKTEEENNDSGYATLHKYENRERDFLPNNIPGAIYKVELDNSHPLAYGYDKEYYTLKLDANIYEFMKDGWNVGVLKKANYVAGFRGFKVSNKLKDGTLFGVNEMGNGSVIFLADNPLFRLFWENGKQLFCNAVFMPN